MESRHLLLDIQDGIALLTINRPRALNSLDAAVLDELQSAFESLGRDQSVKVIVLTGAGEKAFVAGADIAAMADLSVPEALAFARKGQRVVSTIGELDKPVVAAVNGFALGGGLEMAMACDFIYASETARLGLPEVTLGIMPGFGGALKLGRLVGRNRANDLIMTGRMLTATEAKEWGLVNAVFPAADLMTKVLETAGTIAGNGPVGVAYAKDAMRRGLDMGEGDAMEHQALLFAALFATRDQKEGMRAFLEKRKAEFSGS